ncbi:CPBP family intramembrane glutamic endopeptidase [Psychromicrobium xiongbiense]|uniref:CPBP family intramembrane glutamic endopeptidase n=1 Tax=Psychromicrobium xiongbiense TaxID=3051184 RepID=UPI00255743A4|nr:type II CAAX endopeptidase family protein [Psychromicrobium sp. YIM S02556]
MPDAAGPHQLPVRSSLRRRWAAEVLIVIGLSLGKSGVYALVNLLEVASRKPISQATATLNASTTSSEYFDLTYQLLGNFFALVPVALVLFLLWKPGRSGFAAIGFDVPRSTPGRPVWNQPLRDLLWGFGLFVLIGAPSLGLYAAGRALGVTVQIVPNALDSYWWTVPVLILSAVRNAVLEEVVVVGYLFTRLRAMGWSVWWVIVASAVLRGSYHLYQGIGPFVGNVAMGLVFGWFYTRTKRVMPLVIAHSLLDIAAFVFGRQLGFG